MVKTWKEAGCATMGATLGATSGIVWGYISTLLTPSTLRYIGEQVKTQAKQVSSPSDEERGCSNISKECDGLANTVAMLGTNLTINVAIGIPAALEHMATGETPGRLLTTYIALNILSAGYEITRGAIKAGTNLVQRARKTHYNGIEQMVK